MMIIYKKGDTFVDANGKRASPTYIKFAKSIYIAPAYTQVEVHTDPRDKILYTAIDAGGKKQYFYKQFWHDQRDRQKFCKMIDFGRKMPLLKKDIDEKLKTPGWPAEKIAALQLRIIMMCNFRVGNESKTNSTGMSTLRSKHLKISNSPKHRRADIKFIGKSKMENQCSIEDGKVYQLLKELSQLRAKNHNDYVFIDDTGKRVDSHKINGYLKNFGDFTSKNFRTWLAGTGFIKYVQDIDPHTVTTEKDKKSVIREAVKAVAAQLHHTPAICKKKYIYPDLIELYSKDPVNFIERCVKDDHDASFIRFLEAKCGKHNKK